MKKDTNTQKTIMFSQSNFELISGYHEALGSKSFSDTVNILIERAFENIDVSNNIKEQIAAQLNDLKKEIKASKEETTSQANRLVAVYNTGFRLQARTYGIIRKAEESRTTFYDKNWNDLDEDTIKIRKNSNIVCDAIEDTYIKLEFEKLKKNDELKS